jgi:hypothetical protein
MIINLKKIFSRQTVVVALSTKDKGKDAEVNLTHKLLFISDQWALPNACHDSSFQHEAILICWELKLLQSLGCEQRLRTLDCRPAHEHHEMSSRQRYAGTGRSPRVKCQREHAVALLVPRAISYLRANFGCGCLC